MLMVQSINLTPSDDTQDARVMMVLETALRAVVADGRCPPWAYIYMYMYMGYAFFLNVISIIAYRLRVCDFHR